MAKRREEARVNLIVGAFVVVMGTMLLVSLFVIATRDGILREKVLVTSDFRTITGLNDSSKVQLAGHEIGEVVAVEFATKTYQCDPAHEDFGQADQGRTDACDPSLFCAAEDGGLCAELESYAGNSAIYASCGAEGGCASGTICMTQSFRERYRRLPWAGPNGVCVPYQREHHRITVTMRIEADRLSNIRSDSRATIASNGVLGDKLINITVGQGEPVREGGSIQSMPSLNEEIELFKEQLYSISGKVEQGLSGVEGLFSALNNDKTKEELRGVVANVHAITESVNKGEGLVGGLLNDPQYKEDFSATLKGVRNSATSIDQGVAKITRDVPEVLASTRRAADGLAAIMGEIQDPNNQGLVAALMRDPKMSQDVRKALEEMNGALGDLRTSLARVDHVVAEVDTSVTRGEGTLGKLIKDPKAYDDLVKLLGNIERNNVVKRLVRYVIESDEASSSAKPVSANKR